MKPGWDFDSAEVKLTKDKGHMLPLREPMVEAKFEKSKTS